MENKMTKTDAIRVCINTLNGVAVVGEESMRKLLGVIQLLGNIMKEETERDADERAD